METPLVFFFKKIIVYMPGKILAWPKFGHLLPKFLAKIDNLRVYDLLLSNAAMNHLYFGMEYFLMVSFEKIILYMPGKF